jgi:hypothetical protein
MISVKISSPSRIPIDRQIPKSLLSKYIFNINNDAPEADYWFILDDVNCVEGCVCPQDNVYLSIGEPSSIRTYGRFFCRQFANIITSRDNVKHRNIIPSFPLLPWFVGLSFNESIGDLDTVNYPIESIINTTLPDKLNKVAIIISNKRSTEGQNKRVDFILKLKKDLNDDFHIYGNGFTPVKDKHDVHSKYKYSLIIENSIEENYWTEKLSDCFLSGSYPIYIGCPNVFSYFDERGMSILNIDDYDESLKTIKFILASDKYDDCIISLKKNREKVLNEYNLFNQIDKIISIKLKLEQKKKYLVIFPNIQGMRSFKKHYKSVIRFYIGGLKGKLFSRKKIKT